MLGLIKGYNFGKLNEVWVFSGVDLMIVEGEVVVLVVLLGVGKLILLYIVGLLDMLDEGIVEIGGIEVGVLDDC